MAAPRKIDYARIEPDWRAGIKSPKQMAAEYTAATGTSVSHTAITKHFDKLAVPRSLAAKIQAKAEAIVENSMVFGKVGSETNRRETQIVDGSAVVVANVRLSHRTDIQRSKRIANKLMAALEDLKLPGALTGEPTPAQIAAHADQTADVLKAQAGILKQLVDTQRVVVAMEREAFGIAQMVEAPEEVAAVDHAEGVRRLAFLLHSLDAKQRAPAPNQQTEVAHG